MVENTVKTLVEALTACKGIADRNIRKHLKGLIYFHLARLNMQYPNINFRVTITDKPELSAEISKHKMLLLQGEKFLSQCTWLRESTSCLLTLINELLDDACDKSQPFTCKEIILLSEVFKDLKKKKRVSFR